MPRAGAVGVAAALGAVDAVAAGGDAGGGSARGEAAQVQDVRARRDGERESRVQSRDDRAGRRVSPAAPHDPQRARRRRRHLGASDAWDEVRRRRRRRRRSERAAAPADPAPGCGSSCDESCVGSCDEAGCDYPSCDGYGCDGGSGCDGAVVMGCTTAQRLRYLPLRRVVRQRLRRLLQRLRLHGCDIPGATAAVWSGCDTGCDLGQLRL